MKKGFILVLLFLLFYTRFVGLEWGLPYPMHPDERNMAVALQQLNCKEFSNLKECFNPHFFAYGQFPLYAGYIIIQIKHILTGTFGQQISFTDSILGLRVLSVFASVINAFILIKLVRLALSHDKRQKMFEVPLVGIFLIVIFSPYFIQFAHFGTTESLLMLFYTFVVYLSIEAIEQSRITFKKLIQLGIVMGLALSTKVSSALFLAPIIFIFWHSEFLVQKNIFTTKLIRFLFNIAILTMVMVAVFSITSPHSIVSAKEFINTISYESAVATGDVSVFYTRQFENSIPVVFQFVKIFPYTLGWPIYLLAFFGFFLLPWNSIRYNFIRFSFISFFLPTAFLYAKWIRFLAPIFPLMTIFALLFLRNTLTKILKLLNKRRKKITPLGSYIKPVFILILFLVIITPGVAYVSIYSTEDVRFTASRWIYDKIPENSRVLSETANVVDIPVMSANQSNIAVKPYNIISFNFYDLDTNVDIQQELKSQLMLSDYIFVPSRRIFKNHTCDTSLLMIDPAFGQERCGYLKKKYPQLNVYYQNLFSNDYRFKEEVVISSYPRIKVFGKTLIEFRDEDAEETWTVFDHPVIRIYKRI